MSRATPESARDDASGGIIVNHLFRQFGKKFVLQDINVEVYPGEIFGLLGPSGAGKTTLVKLIAGIDTPTRGWVTISGVRMPQREMLGRLGYMAQSDALYMDVTATRQSGVLRKFVGVAENAAQTTD